MKRIFCGVLAALGMIGSAACSTAEDDVGDGSQDIAIDKNTEDPARILPPDFDTRLSALISPADVGKSFGLDDAHVPYPDTYWPFRVIDENKEVVARNGIDHRWQGPREASPLEKYARLHR